MLVVLLASLCLTTFTSSSASEVTEEDFRIQKQLINALENNPFAQFAVRETFFPRMGNPPVCNPVTFQLTCNDTEFTYNATNLWTSYDAESSVGQILLSSAYYGILVRGFDWESSCNTESNSQLFLGLQLAACGDNITTDSNRTLERQLLAFTAALKAYADSPTPSTSTLTNNKGYAIAWKEPDKENRIFRTSYAILTTMVAFLDFFIVVFSVGICSTVYNAIYHEIKGKKNPYYPLFAAAVVCTVFWNAGPGWLVLQFDTNHIRYSFIVLIPFQLLLAVLMKKYPDFPVPGLPCTRKTYIYLEDEEQVHKKKGNDKENSKKKTSKSESYFFWKICHMKFKGTVIASFVIQTIAIWSLLVFFTYIAYYSVGITISLYLYPIQTLVKVIFIKAVVVCLVFDIAILFSGKPFDIRCTRKGVISDIAIVFASLSLLPVIAFVGFVAGGVIFTSSTSQLNGIQGVLALLPSMVLLLVGWYSKGTLFPEKLIADDETSEATLSDIEAAAKDDAANPGKTINQQKYGATDSP